MERNTVIFSNQHIAVFEQLTGGQRLRFSGNRSYLAVTPAVFYGEIIGLGVIEIQGAACHIYRTNITAIQIDIGFLGDCNTGISGIVQQFDHRFAAFVGFNSFLQGVIVIGVHTGIDQSTVAGTHHQFCACDTHRVIRIALQGHLALKHGILRGADFGIHRQRTEGRDGDIAGKGTLDDQLFVIGDLDIGRSTAGECIAGNNRISAQRQPAATGHIHSSRGSIGHGAAGDLTAHQSHRAYGVDGTVGSSAGFHLTAVDIYGCGCRAVINDRTGAGGGSAGGLQNAAIQAEAAIGAGFIDVGDQTVVSAGGAAVGGQITGNGTGGISTVSEGNVGTAGHTEHAGIGAGTNLTDQIFAVQVNAQGVVGNIPTGSGVGHTGRQIPVAGCGDGIVMIPGDKLQVRTGMTGFAFCLAAALTLHAVLALVDAACRIGAIAGLIVQMDGSLGSIGAAGRCNLYAVCLRGGTAGGHNADGAGVGAGEHQLCVGSDIYIAGFCRCIFGCLFMVAVDLGIAANGQSGGGIQTCAAFCYTGAIDEGSAGDLAAVHIHITCGIYCAVRAAGGITVGSNTTVELAAIDIDGVIGTGVGDHRAAVAVAAGGIIDAVIQIQAAGKSFIDNDQKAPVGDGLLCIFCQSRQITGKGTGHSRAVGDRQAVVAGNCKQLGGAGAGYFSGDVVTVQVQIQISGKGTVICDGNMIGQVIVTAAGQRCGFCPGFKCNIRTGMTGFSGSLAAANALGPATFCCCRKYSNACENSQHQYDRKNSFMHTVLISYVKLCFGHVSQDAAGTLAGMLALGDDRGAVDDHIVHAGAVLPGVGEGGVDLQILQGEHVHIRIEAGHQHATLFQPEVACHARGGLADRILQGDHAQIPDIVDKEIEHGHIVLDIVAADQRSVTAVCADAAVGLPQVDGIFDDAVDHGLLMEHGALHGDRSGLGQIRGGSHHIQVAVHRCFVPLFNQLLERRLGHLRPVGRQQEQKSVPLTGTQEVPIAVQIVTNLFPAGGICQDFLCLFPALSVQPGGQQRQSVTGGKGGRQHIAEHI